MTAPHDNPRRSAALILADSLANGTFPERMLEKGVPQRALVQEWVYGSMRQRRVLDFFIGKLAENPPSPMPRALLFVGLYQLFFSDGIEDHAAVNETVEAGAGLVNKRSCGFINAILRRAIRERDELREALAQQLPPIRLSHPTLLAERWTERWGAEAACELMEWNNRRPRTILIANQLKTTSAALAELLAAAEIETTPHPARPERALILARGHDVATLPGFAEGHFTVQDPATLMCVDLLDPQPGETILDACAAPGGKTALIAQAMQTEGSLTATELHEDRLPRLRENVARLQLDPFVQIQLADACDANQLATISPENGFDRALVDAPCTNTGVLARRQDARWHFGPSRIRRLTRAQRGLLDAVSTVIRPGGVMVYSTCSLEPEENEIQIRSWLSENDDFTLEQEQLILPTAAHTDGAYAALLRRSGASTQ
jgi:16S rRNA (cytosine967-C5)-methyltransferase